MSAFLILMTWIVSSAAALFGHLWAANDARKDYVAVKEDSHLESLLFTAQGNMRLSLALAFVQGIDLAIGVLGFADRPAPASPAAPSMLAILITVGLLGQELMLLGISFAVVWFRRRLREIVRAELAAKQ